MLENETQAGKSHTDPDVGNIYTDQKRVVYAILALLGVAVLQTTLGIMALSRFFSKLPNDSLWIGRLCLFQAVLTYGMALGTYFNRSFFAMGGTIIAGLGLLASLFFLNVYLIAISLACFLLILQGYLTLRKIDVRVAKQEQDDPMVEFYHRLIPVLVRVMSADSHLDRREKKKIRALCDNMKISKYEQQNLIRRALQYKNNPIEPLVDNLLQAANNVGYVAPERKILSAVFAVAAADGVFVTEEVKLLHHVASQLQVNEGVVPGMLRQYQIKLSDIQPATAREVLSVSPEATREQIRDSYHAFMQDFEAEEYEDIGKSLKEHILKRKQVVEKAFQVLQDSSNNEPG